MSATPEQRDGRTVRAERTGQALVDSLLARAVRPHHADAAPIDSNLPLRDRVQQFSQQRGRLYERIGGVRRAAPGC